MAREGDGFQIEDEDGPIPAAEAELPDFGTEDAFPAEDVEAERDVRWEAEDFGTSDEAQPETQGEDPLVAQLGEDGDGDLAPEDE